MSKFETLLKEKMSEESFQKLAALKNEKVMDFVGTFAEHCDPKSIYVCDDSEKDTQYVREQALAKGEEHTLANSKQTIHWDGYGDQARDKKNTRFMVYKENMDKMASLNSVEYEEGLSEIMGIAKGIMKGKDAVVLFYSEGPTQSPFTIPCVQFTDSWYVAHSENILYRTAYSHFLNMKDDEKDDFFRFIHSAGELDENGCTVNLKNRRIYMDTQNNIVYSMNDQYAGNSVGLKKHSMRLAINKSGQEGWLCEHMFVMAAVDKKKDRKTYFCGAYPSACGKTSTAMIPGEQIVGDDIAYFRNINGEFRAVNVEFGMFGIIKDVNEQDDPVIFKNLMIDQEVIFSNVLRGKDNKPYWLGMGVDAPEEGRNHFGEWKKGVKDANGNEVGVAHGNARYTMRLDYLDNIDKAGFEAKDGVKVEGVLYGGRDSDITVPVEESPNWKDGILLKAATLESETTSATLGQEGVRTPSPMANMDFVSYPLGTYTMNNIKFGESVKDVPKVFSNNYFMRGEDGKFMTSKLAKKVWLHWAEGRIHGEYEALDTPTGKIPLYEDLKALFKEHLDEDFSKEKYDYLFTFRCTKWVDKLERTKAYYKKMDPNTPQEIFDYWDAAIAKINKAKEQYGDLILPGAFKG
ncbi:MAG: phosphoenolpyruvate carboxykinase (GTP) [Sphaerochaeta sp.]|uniref:phosphoenolpyruvate carboxykinase (GTP) n=1 Tax=Sphaerochaeta sp. S2 TaxID=2798868 RepID=UPI0018E9769D|nr:phosphoenolpyruvate carboxykinase (GTP) [Sphaerochaeta sp. S2]MCK9348290.1 phosphoenolpyruvate carboxykinase (GTP) [Sphaerochaeta sp.]MBJ2355701.1 phosphoenolpyruvate carboxykinase (GTP) [Sphaerochaeta sp. S2]MDD4302061.1 phosphoenolpyruvate carboxykinase (GTP) [Sphaerochaeta sp.]MDD4647344.1 phosphoenolpyruvate carboxykinase (GTP) [Sphaerochaeta sp.]MDY0243934.1 phosphoenolpyruvate carboxykinase (GTP) [Sphaerochaeta sp.]